VVAKKEVGPYLKPYWRQTPDPGVSYGEYWQMVSSDVSNYHQVGRTISGLRMPDVGKQIEDLCEDFPPDTLKRNPRGWKALSQSQKLDLIATEILRQYEQESGYTRIADKKLVLSMPQWAERKRREIPLSIEQLTALDTHNDRCHVYRGHRGPYNRDTISEAAMRNNTSTRTV
jgi:hypothetical protein